ncbi:MAG: GNAT family N-acetyltransferase [Gaiellaceae bacterium]
MRIEIDDLRHPEVLALLNEHLRNMSELSPPEQVFALDVTKLREPDITFWTVWDGEVLLGCGALKELSPTQGEIKSMRTPQMLRRRGAGRAVLTRIVEVARQRGYTTLSLETGSHPAFQKAQKLYQSFGFAYCGPFGSYRDNGHSVFMSLGLAGDAARPAE